MQSDVLKNSLTDELELVNQSQAFDCNSTLVVIPCSSKKASLPGAKAAGPSILDQLPLELSRQLIEARRAVASDALVEEASLVAAWQRYRGTLYEVAASVLGAKIETGDLRHLLILSGGYGVVHALEPIGNYNFILKRGRWPKGLLSQVIAAYARFHGLSKARLFAGDSTDYAKVLKNVRWADSGVEDVILYSPERARGALKKTPRTIGEGLVAMLHGTLTDSWKSSDGLSLQTWFPD